VEQQRLAKQAERERKQLLRDQQDQQRRLDRQARDEACRYDFGWASYCHISRGLQPVQASPWSCYMEPSQ
jgi:hypothetical protein